MLDLISKLSYSLCGDLCREKLIGVATDGAANVTGHQTVQVLASLVFVLEKHGGYGLGRISWSWMFRRYSMIMSKNHFKIPCIYLYPTLYAKLI